MLRAYAHPKIDNSQPTVLTSHLTFILTCRGLLGVYTTGESTEQLNK